jgi:hypothetical protein
VIIIFFTKSKASDVERVGFTLILAPLIRHILASTLPSLQQTIVTQGE